MFDLTILAIPFPDIGPVAFKIGPVAIRWYALSYVLGLVLGWRFLRLLAAQNPKLMATKDADDVLLWSTLGVVLGGRLGYVLFYKPGFYLENLDQVLVMWRGGMSFHGGLLGVTLAIILFARARKLTLLSVSDLVACTVPIGLFLGRIANFINGELWGRVTTVSWGMVFPSPQAGPLPRHPSQLYEAFLEGVVLFLVLWLVRRRTGALDRPGILTGVFCCGYAVSRIIVEFFRQPDAHLGYFAGFVTMGQILSLPLLAFGIFLIWWGLRRAAEPVPKA